MFCHSCGKHVKQDDKYCGYCGEKLSLELSGTTEEKIDRYNSPKAKTILVFGLLGILGLISCGLLSFFSIPAWVMGKGELQKYPYDERVRAGKTMGIIGAVLLMITVVIVIILVTSIIDKMPIKQYR